ncbi:hypothetical protein QTI66_18080 [Variovorax sp. J22R133]|uniref:hypothetical protein n=1 Tax=Variovorax brevis TaxID=3053503 RepID=UPI0025786D7F|nr:hypothetical protein [Variovorax sp. J22R133]MDM0114068.1 hypothetical protein [Variovorax sp. J22R133]
MNHHVAMGCRVAALVVAAALAGCNDRGGADASKSAPPAAATGGPAASAASTPAAPKRTYVIARLVPQGGTIGSRDQKSTLYVVDPAKPAAPEQSIVMDGGAVSAFGVPMVASLQSFRFDRATRLTTYEGEAVVFFVKDAKVWKIDLRTDLPHTPVQVSSLTTACRLSVEIEPLRVSADGRDGWIKVDTQGPSGACTQQGAGGVYVRSTMPATAAPLASLPGEFVDTLDDGAQTMVAFLMLTPAGLELFRPDFTRIGPVEGGAGARVAQLMGYDFSTLKAGYYRVDGTVRRLAWTATAATLAAPIHTFARADFGTRNVACHADVDAFYFADNNKLMKVAGAGQPSEIATLPGLPVYAIMVSQTHLALWQADPANPRSPPSVAAISKRGGAPVMVQNASLMGATATRMVYRSGRTTHAVKFDGTDDILLGESAVIGSDVHASHWIADNHYIDSYVACVPATAGDKQCTNGKIVQTDLETQAKTEVGVLSHGGAGLQYGNSMLGMVFPVATGVPSFVTYQDRAARPRAANAAAGGAAEVYTWTPGVAHSLVKLATPNP